ncbi:hypothetical protein EHS25_003989 [Saitozyma podzolica]|uniref:Major facilitator superfamily (MFS) profile domain-containing protein n=1 Tax=Saitozyma podzolica TaxID=1890683 RepID=A0A427YT26_9TREE|nr:hypothetical protein EHS25_003989 [Saitozyma podzolica]
MNAEEAVNEAQVVDMLPLGNELAPAESKLEMAGVEDTKGEVQLLRSNYADWPKAKVIRKFWRLYGFGLAAGLAGMLHQPFGTVHDPVTGELELDAKYVSFWSGFNFVSQILSQAVSPMIGDRFGRRVNMYLYTASMIIAIILEIVSTNWKGYLGAKVMVGIACGFLGTTCMTYLSELVMPQMRGSILAAFSFSWQIGGLMSAVGLQVLVTQTKPLAYRNIFYSEFVVVGIWVIALVLLPESPSWLAINHKHDQGKKALKWLVGNVEGYDNFIGVPLVFGQTTYFFQNAGLRDAFLASLIISIIGLVSLGCSIYLIERLGRRTLVLWGAAVMIVCDLLIGGLGIPTITPGLGSGLITLSSIWMFAYQTSLGPIGWTALVEISTPVLRAKTASIATILQSFSGVLFNYTVPLMLSDQYAGWGAKIGFFFGGLSIAYWLACYTSFPETKNRTYAELDELFERGIPPRLFHKTKTLTEENASAHP